ncbi:hypothetical protein [Halostella pelagica]|uniref:hypothetical protein n=1 Tax=Halostella pelagica TaxID=2583824 RepID=UPI00108138C8|nr:hypothetical protein [Halostella pelagica]
MVSDQIWEHEVTYHPEDVQDRSTKRYQHYRVYLPDTIEKLGLEDDEHVTLEKRIENGVPFILGEKHQGDPSLDCVYQIFTDGSSRYRVTLPTEWIDDFIEYEGDDILIVEVNTIDDEFRIYKNIDDDYSQRKAELDNNDRYPRLGKSVLAPAAVASSDSESKSSLREGFGDDIDDEGPAEKNP